MAKETTATTKMGKLDSHLSSLWVLAALFVAVFVTICIYVYAGKQSDLPAREFPDTTIKGDLTVDNAIANSFGFIALSNGLGAPALGTAQALPAAGSVLTKNTLFSGALATDDYLLPTRANSTAGDWIVVHNTADMANGELVTIGSAANGDFAVGGMIQQKAGGTAAIANASDFSTAGDNSIAIAGLTNGSGGAGTYAVFVYSGSAWHAYAAASGIGTGAEPIVGATGTRFAATA